MPQGTRHCTSQRPPAVKVPRKECRDQAAIRAVRAAVTFLVTGTFLYSVHLLPYEPAPVALQAPQPAPASIRDYRQIPRSWDSIYFLIRTQFTLTFFHR